MRELSSLDPHLEAGTCMFAGPFPLGRRGLRDLARNARRQSSPLGGAAQMSALPQKPGPTA
jgi:hypothetical protein